MSDLVDPSAIERIVGAPRHPTAHYGRAVSKEQTVYVLHSQACKDSVIDLRECEFSVALDTGRFEAFGGVADIAVALGIDSKGRLMPISFRDELWRPQRQAFDSGRRPYLVYRVVKGVVEYLRSEPSNYAPKGRTRKFTREKAIAMADSLNLPR